MARNYNVALPFWFAKLDIKDGFWRLVVNSSDAWNFAYVLPSLTNKQIDIDGTELVIPTSLQTGWCESPPFFYASSETVRDVIQTLLTNDCSPPHHPFEDLMMADISQILPTRDDGKMSGGTKQHASSAAHLPNTTSTDLVEVFVDDFIAATNAQDLPHIQHISRAMLHGVHTIYPPRHITKHTGADPIARKKLEKGDGLWRTEKDIIGWIFDGVQYTMRLPHEKCERILLQIKKVLKYKAPSKSLPRTTWEIPTHFVWHSRRLRFLLAPTNGVGRNTGIHHSHASGAPGSQGLARNHPTHEEHTNTGAPISPNRATPHWVY